MSSSGSSPRGGGGDFRERLMNDLVGEVSKRDACFFFNYMPQLRKLMNNSYGEMV